MLFQGVFLKKSYSQIHATAEIASIRINSLVISLTLTKWARTINLWAEKRDVLILNFH